MKALTANRLTDGEAVWWSKEGRWSDAIGGAELADDKAGEARLEGVGREGIAGNLVVDVNLIDVELVGGVVRPLRLRERIRANGPTIHPELGKQATART